MYVHAVYLLQIRCLVIHMYLVSIKVNILCSALKHFNQETGYFNQETGYFDLK